MSNIFIIRVAASAAARLLSSSETPTDAKRTRAIVWSIFSRASTSSESSAKSFSSSSSLLTLSSFSDATTSPPPKTVPPSPFAFILSPGQTCASSASLTLRVPSSRPSSPNFLLAPITASSIFASAPAATLSYPRDDAHVSPRFLLFSKVSSVKDSRFVSPNKPTSSRTSGDPSLSSSPEPSPVPDVSPDVDANKRISPDFDAKRTSSANLATA
mmetsp:Transcript_418/g.1637  ORF Transcript_418/g.1637 Transcript_418/m.1637 type:complete len:214 (-) Transcript_418:356-997(-)